VIKILKRIFNLNSLRKIYSLLSRCVLKDNQIRHLEPSIIYSKECSNTTPELIEIIAEAAKLASQTTLHCGKKNLPDSRYLNVFPGEHYRFINSLVKTINAKKIVEIGTFTGMGALSLKEGSNDVLVTTYDIIKWNNIIFPSHFKSSDFDESLKQIIGDLSQDYFFDKNLNILNEADLIFMDAPKDNIFEYKMAKQFQKLKNKNKKFLILDDILFVNMIDFWRNIKSPKIDATSFGHFTGTGIVDISNGFLFY
tara:strand:- start:863 stop:1621 length:759 start_codon:yes stop_codon:yes gene_type:complete